MVDVRHARPVAGRARHRSRSRSSSPPAIGVRDNRFETTNTKADVIFAFFGYNESFAGEAGLAKFKRDLERSSSTRSRRSTTASGSALVLFSPIAHRGSERAPQPARRQGNNKRLELYTKAMGEVAQKPTVSPSWISFIPTRNLYGKTAKPLTINGIHLNERRQRGRGEDHRSGTVCQEPEPQRRPAGAGETPPGRPRQELLLVQPLSRPRRLQRLRRPGRS